ncbi:hypothetical protein GW835_01085 [archaeon]|nr:hypothetical protein [archaeon]NCP79147.1 hypothetical protein [archaeon]NCQ06914.1 hypothetical protein [archaeon]NCQ50710.1 hypothetical protein [archaeon]NCT58152.1 hypothetical protein [archaeon]
MNLKKIMLILVAIMLLAIPITANEVNYDIINLNADTYNYNPTPVISGEDFEIWIQLTNKSNVAAENVEYFLETEYPFILISENEGLINKLEPFQSKIIKYKLKTNTDVLTGTYDLEFRYKREGSNIYNVKKYIIDVKGKSAIIELIDSSFNNAKIGADGTVTLNLKNLGQKNAKDIFLTLNDSEDESIKVIDLKTQYIEKINTEEETEVSFKINISKNAENISYSLPLTISYSDVDREYTITRNIGLKLEDQPKMILNVLDIGTNFKIKENSEEKISVEIYNIGNVDTEVSYITVNGEGIRPTQEFIGSIEKNNYDTIELTINTTDIKEKETKLIINLFYKDSNLKEEKITQEITVEVMPQANGQGANKVIMSIFSILLFIVGLAILILLIKWLIRILIKPALNVLKETFKRRK